MTPHVPKEVQTKGVPRRDQSKMIEGKGKWGDVATEKRRRQISRFRRVKSIIGDYEKFKVSAAINKRPMEFAVAVWRTTWRWIQHDQCSSKLCAFQQRSEAEQWPNKLKHPIIYICNNYLAMKVKQWRRGDKLCQNKAGSLKNDWFKNMSFPYDICRSWNYIYLSFCTG